MKAYINTQKTYKIWLSNNPNQFLNPENMLRYILHCVNNPNSQKTFIYTSLILSKSAMENLHQFTAKFNITAVDFKDLKPASPRDKELLDIGAIEIIRWVLKTGGNPAGASGAARILQCTASAYGIYTDFDTTLNTSHLPLLVETKSMIINADGNNDFLAFACDEDGKLTPETLRMLKELQDIMISHYRDPITALKKYKHSPEFQIDLDALIALTKKQHKTLSIWDLINKLEHLTPMEYAREYMNQAVIYNRSIDFSPEYKDMQNPTFDLTEDKAYELIAKIEIRIDQAGKCINLFKIKDLIAPLPKGLQYRKRGESNFRVLKHDLMITLVCEIGGPDIFIFLSGNKSFHIKHLPVLANAFYSANNTKANARCTFEEIGATGDLSWSNEGVNNAKKRDERIETSIINMQSFIRGYITRTQYGIEKDAHVTQKCG